MSAGAAVIEAAREVVVMVADRLQETALDIISGPGGVLVLVLGLAGVAVLLHDAVRIGYLLSRAWHRSAQPPRRSRAVGLPRDALTLVVPKTAAPRSKVPATARHAVQTPPTEIAAIREAVREIGAIAAEMTIR